MRLGPLPPTRQEASSISNIGESDTESAAGALDEELHAYCVLAIALV